MVLLTGGVGAGCGVPFWLGAMVNAAALNLALNAGFNAIALLFAGAAGAEVATLTDRISRS